MICKIHGDTEHFKRKDVNAYRCRRCHNDAVIRRRQKIKRTLVEEHGGKCRRCGYNKCIAALQFHHLDPSKKEWTISKYSRSLDRLREEANKCILLCANCHVEIESPVM